MALHKDVETYLLMGTEGGGHLSVWQCVLIILHTLQDCEIPVISSCIPEFDSRADISIFTDVTGGKPPDPNVTGLKQVRLGGWNKKRGLQKGGYGPSWTRWAHAHYHDIHLDSAVACRDPGMRKDRRGRNPQRAGLASGDGERALGRQGQWARRVGRKNPGKDSVWSRKAFRFRFARHGQGGRCGRRKRSREWQEFLWQFSTDNTWMERVRCGATRWVGRRRRHAGLAAVREQMEARGWINGWSSSRGSATYVLEVRVTLAIGFEGWRVQYVWYCNLG